MIAAFQPPMTRLNPHKLLNSKWTATQPRNKEKHFLITEVEFDAEGLIVVSCVIEAVMTHRAFSIDWQQLKNSDLWVQGWK